MDRSITKALGSFSKRLGFQRDWYLIGIGALVGTLTGVGAVGFDWAVHELSEFTRHLQLGEVLTFGLGERAGLLWLFLAPAIGMGLTGVIVQLFASEAKGHGVPQVMKALIVRGGQIPARIGAVKVVASILTVGSGGSAGTEGPIVQIGATAGSQAGRLLRLDRQGVQTLVGCGAAAGISSIFNAPIAGVFFVLEILLRDFSIKIFTPIVVASVFSQVTTQALLGENEAIFATGELVRGLQFRALELPSYIGLGLLCGLVALVFNRVLHYGEDLYEKVPLHPMLKPITGAMLLAGLGVGFVLAATEGLGGETPPFYSNGYGFIESLISPDEGGVGYGLALLLAVLVLKILATTFTLASGGSGGVFAPSLFMGASAGAFFGVLLDTLGLLPEGSTPSSYALVGMAAVVAASTQAPLTAILILFELSQDFKVVLPIMLSAVIATVMSQVIDRDSIYTFRLRKAGVLTGQAKDLMVLRRLTVAQVRPTDLPPEPIYASDPLAKLVEMHAYHRVPDFAVVDQEGKYLGLVTGSDMRSALIDREAIPLLLVAELVRPDIPSVTLDETLDSVMSKLSQHDVATLCRVDNEGRPRSLVTRGEVLKRYQTALEQM
ncbi:MAG: chloride channel protein [Planctomycetota bacterium]